MRCGDDIQWKSFAVAVAASLSCGCVWRESRRCVRARPSAPGRSIGLLADILLDLVSDLFASVRGRPGRSVSGGVCGVGQRHCVIHAWRRRRQPRVVGGPLLLAALRLLFLLGIALADGSLALVLLGLALLLSGGGGLDCIVTPLRGIRTGVVDVELDCLASADDLHHLLGRVDRLEDVSRLVDWVALLENQLFGLRALLGFLGLLWLVSALGAPGLGGIRPAACRLLLASEDCHGRRVASDGGDLGDAHEFELVGIAQISPVGSYPTPVAVLRSKQQAARRRTNTAQARRPQGGNQPQQAQKTEESTQSEKLIFKEGDPINKTGYILKAIYPSQKMVEVVRGSETIKLYINYAGADATKRRDDAVQAAAARQKERQAEEDQRQASIRQRNAQQEQEAQRREEERAANNPGLPPPPPGMDDAMPLANTTNAATNAPAGAPTDRSEQIRNQVEQNVRQQTNTAPRRRRPGADTTPRLSPNAPTR